MATDIIGTPGVPLTLDLFYLGARAIYNAKGVDWFTFQIYRPGTAWPSGPTPVVAVRYSNDVIEFTDTGTAITLSAAGITAAFYVAPVAFVCLEVTTIGPSTSVWTVVGYGQ